MTPRAFPKCVIFGDFVANFVEILKGELLRIPLLGTSVNKGKGQGRNATKARPPTCR
jgi:hypothetical protein